MKFSLLLSKETGIDRYISWSDLQVEMVRVKIILFIAGNIGKTWK